MDWVLGVNLYGICIVGVDECFGGEWVFLVGVLCGFG